MKADGHTGKDIAKYLGVSRLAADQSGSAIGRECVGPNGVEDVDDVVDVRFGEYQR